jgi:hypothetical protein
MHRSKQRSLSSSKREIAGAPNTSLNPWHSLCRVKEPSTPSEGRLRTLRLLIFCLRSAAGLVAGYKNIGKLDFQILNGLFTPLPSSNPIQFLLGEVRYESEILSGEHPIGDEAIRASECQCPATKR